ncbi:MAG: hypothetical protein ACTHJ0_02470 [Flavipsychrobacter sp.]
MLLRNIALLSFAALTFLSACQDSEESNMAEIARIQDTVLKLYANTSQVTVGVKYHTDLSVVIWDDKLYNGTDQERQQRANEVGNLALTVFGKDNKLEKGRFAVVKSTEKNAVPDESVEKGCNINIDSLKKTNGK